MFEVPSNPESVWITALILALIITPATSWMDMQFLTLAFWAAACAIASKYILAIRGKHIFNPAAVGVVLTSLVLGLSASWWVGTLAMVPFVLIGGLLIVRKIQRFDLFFAFLGAFALGIIYFSLEHHLNLGLSLSQSFLYAPAFFFATVMLTEPATTPPTRFLRILYGAFVGFLFLPNVSIGSFYFTPELALIAGNIFVYIVSPKYKLMLEYLGPTRLSADVYEFAFASNRPISFKPGQYMEWTLAHAHPDSRSVRRYFTLSSSPTEQEIKLGVKFYEPASTFKKTLLLLESGAKVMAGQLAGDFTLPRDKKKKLVFIAGGIGVTPFRSMIKYLLDRGEKRDIVLFYSNRTAADVVYEDIFNEAAERLGIRVVYAITDMKSPGYSGPINDLMMTSEVPDYKERYFYISGPHAMVVGFEETLKGLGIRKSHIKTDFFPGFV
jgi:ferredoxin-NADP reductase